MDMCSKIDKKDIVNKLIMEATLSHQPSHVLQGYDYDENGQRVSFYESENSDCEKHVLPRLLEIRIGAKVSVTQNLDQGNGVINNTRGFVQRKVVIIEEELTKELIPVTKVKQKIHIMRTNKTYYKVAFPLILSWVSTIHRGQGFTIDTLHAYIDETVFTDGQVYKAISRVRRLEDLHIKKLHLDAFKMNSTVRGLMAMARDVLKSDLVYDCFVCTQPTSSREAKTTQYGQHKDVDSSPHRNKHLQLPDNMSLPSELRCVHLQMTHLDQEVL